MNSSHTPSVILPASVKQQEPGSPPSGDISPSDLARRRSGGSGPPRLWSEAAREPEQEQEAPVDNQGDFDDLLSFNSQPVTSTRAQDVAKKFASMSVMERIPSSSLQEA
eukprot:3375141-Rhodomonas_salina.3